MPSDRWQEAYRANRERTRCPADLSSYFTSAEIAGMRMAVIPAGTCTVSTGGMLVRDPMTYLGDPGERPYMQEAPVGEHPVDIAVVLECDRGMDRYAAARVRFSDAEPVAFYEALVGYEDIYHMKDGEYFGFNSDSGLACICDMEAHASFCDWLDEMIEDDPEFEFYGDYLDPLMRENAAANPAHQREGGDWLCWNVPETYLNVTVVQTGFGDGAYPVYWGYDENGAVCQMVVQFIDVEMTFGQQS